MEACNVQDDVFNYELVRLRYLESCKEHFKMEYSITGPWTRKARKHIISSLKEGDIVLTLMRSVYNFQSDVLAKYEIVLEDGEEKLVLTGTSIEVLPYEDCYDIFVELHNKTGHGGFDVILKKLENTFLINDKCLNIFLLSCNVCKKFNLQKMKLVAFNDCVSVEILKAPIPDHECRFILFYIDKVTSYMLLRPLIAMDVYEISLEMLKIFTDFGPPVVINTIHALLFKNVLTLLEQGGFAYDISIRESENVNGESYYLMQQILARTNQDSNFWTVTCCFIQYKHNNGQLPMRDPILNKVVHTTVKPFNQLFNTKHSTKNQNVAENQALLQNKDKDVSSTSDTSSNVETTVIEEYVISSESSDTETASEIDECVSLDTLEQEENVYLNRHHTQSELNETEDPCMQIHKITASNPTFGNMDFKNVEEITIEECIDLDTDKDIASATDRMDTIKIEENVPLNIYSSKSNLMTVKDTSIHMDSQDFSCTNVDKMNTTNKVDIKIENNSLKYDLLQNTSPPKCHASNLETFTQTISTPKIEKSNVVASKTVTPLIVDNIPLKVEPVLDRTMIPSGSGSEREENRRHIKSNENDGDCCSACKGKMLTDYLCFGCQKKTHIFCMNRVTNPLESITDTVLSFTYCKLCLKAKYNLTDAVKINS